MNRSSLNVFGAVDYALESLGMPYRNFGEHFSVEQNFAFLQRFHELRVSHTGFAASGIDTDDPQASKIALADMTVPERVRARVNHRLFRGFESISPRTAIALCRS